MERQKHSPEVLEKPADPTGAFCEAVEQLIGQVPHAAFYRQRDGSYSIEQPTDKRVKAAATHAEIPLPFGSMRLLRATYAGALACETDIGRIVPRSAFQLNLPGGDTHGFLIVGRRIDRKASRSWAFAFENMLLGDGDTNGVDLAGLQKVSVGLMRTMRAGGQKLPDGIRIASAQELLDATRQLSQLGQTIRRHA